jgi:tripartite-type tricarboxylate transporter receptor subunit TctC
VAFAKSQSRKLSYVSPGVGSPPHLAGDQIARRSGIEMLHVPYRGVVPAITDLIAGHVDTISVSIGPMQASLQGGTSRPLFALTPKRLPYFPNIPTSDEVGLPGLRMSTWFGIMAPKGTPAAIVEQLNGYARAMLDDPAVQKRLADSRLEPMPMTTAEFTAFLKSETPQWERAVREAGIQGAE